MKAATTTAGFKRGVAHLIVSGFFLVVAEHFVGFADFLEFSLGTFVVRIFVRMKFHRLLAIRFFYFSLTSIFAHAEHFVIIALGH